MQFICHSYRVFLGGYAVSPSLLVNGGQGDGPSLSFQQVVEDGLLSVIGVVITAHHSVCSLFVASQSCRDDAIVTTTIKTRIIIQMLYCITPYSKHTHMTEIDFVKRGW